MPKVSNFNKFRRSRRRFPIQQELRYQCVKGTRVSIMGLGRTISISSGEVRFTTQEPLKPGDKVTLAINWPALLDNTCRMKLVIHGWVTSSEANAAEVRIEHYEFRTRSNSVNSLAAAAGY